MGRKSRAEAIAVSSATETLADSLQDGTSSRYNEVIDSLAPEMRAAVDYIDSAFASIQETSLRSFWNIGRTLKKVTDDPHTYLTDDQRMSGVSAEGLLFSLFAPIYSVEQLRHAVSFYESYPMAQDVDRLINMRCEERPRWRMTMSHVQLLAQVNDPDKRAALEQKVSDDAYTARALAVELQEIRGKINQNSGRKHRSPKGLKQQLLDLVEHQRKFIARSETLWLAEDADETVYDTFINTPPEEIDATMTSYFHEISENFDAMMSLITIHKRLCVKIDQELYADKELQEDTSED